MDTLTLALDWTPNVNHAGIFVALMNNYYEEEGIELELIAPDVDQYSNFPIDKAANGKVDIAMCPSEHVLQWNYKEDPKPMVAIATVFQEDMSAYIYHRQAELDRPADLDGKTYAMYGTTFEKQIVQHFIMGDGGKGRVLFETPGKLDLWQLFKEKKVDFCWVFKTWEWVEAQQENLDVDLFNLGDFGVPYGYSPIFCAEKSIIKDKEKALKKFLKATAKGFEFASDLPNQTAKLLHQSKSHPNFDDIQFLERALDIAGPAFLDDAGLWGRINTSHWDGWFVWLLQKGIFKDSNGNAPDIKTDGEDKMHTNLLLP